MPNSYRDPAYDTYDRMVEESAGLPRGLLSSIRTKGERSNADQVSEAGARTVYQIVPATRASVLQKYGIDAYAGPAQAAQAAGLLLRDSLRRNNGNVAAAVAEYHGGTDRSQWGPRTRAYVQRVTKGGDLPSGSGPASQVAAWRAQRNAGPDVSQYPDIRAAASSRLQKAEPIPQDVIDAYNSRRMSDEDRAIIDRDVKNGTLFVPKGQKLTVPPPRTVGEQLGIGTRAILENAGGLVDYVAGPANELVNMTGLPNALGYKGLTRTPFRNAARSASDAMGLATPETDSENLASAIIGGGTQGLLTAGAGLAASGVGGATGAIGRALATNPVLDTLSGATSGASAETARQAGAGPVGQVAAGLVGGAAPIGLAGTAARVAARVRPRSLPEVVAETPRAAVLDDAGNLTPHGQEVAARTGASPEEVRAAYEAPPAVQRGTANEQVAPAVAREATTGERVAPEPVESPAAAPAAAPERVAAPEAPPVAAAPETLPETALARVEQAKSVGVDLTRGQASKNFDIQDAEQRLKNSNGPEAEQMRQFQARQTEQIKQASDQFRQGFDDPTLSAEQRGQMVQDAVRELRDQGKEGVSALYKAARELGQEVPLETDGIRQIYDRLMVEANVPDSVKSELTQEMARYGIIGKAGGTAENGVTTVKIDNGAGGQQAIRFYGQPETLRMDNAEALRKVISDLYTADGPRKLTQMLKGAIDDATETAAEKLAGQKGAGLPEAMKAAREAHQQQVQTFRAKDVVQDIVDWKKGAEGITGKLKPEQVMQQALSSTSNLKRIKAVLLSKGTPKSKAAWGAIQGHGLAQIFEKALTRNTNVAGEITEAISGAKLRSAIESFGVDKLKVLLEPDQFSALMKLRRVIEDATIPISGTVNHSNSGNLIMRLVKDADTKISGLFATAGYAVAGPPGAMVGGAVGRSIAPAIKAGQEAKAAAETLKGATEYTPAQAATETAGTAPEPGMAAKAASAAKETGSKAIRTFIDIYSSPRVLAPVLASTGATENE